MPDPLYRPYTRALPLSRSAPTVPTPGRPPATTSRQGGIAQSRAVPSYPCQDLVPHLYWQRIEELRKSG